MRLRNNFKADRVMSKKLVPRKGYHVMKLAVAHKAIYEDILV